MKCVGVAVLILLTLPIRAAEEAQSRWIVLAGFSGLAWTDVLDLVAVQSGVEIAVEVDRLDTPVTTQSGRYTLDSLIQQVAEATGTQSAWLHGLIVFKPRKYSDVSNRSARTKVGDEAVIPSHEAATRFLRSLDGEQITELSHGGYLKIGSLRAEQVTLLQRIFAAAVQEKKEPLWVREHLLRFAVAIQFRLHVRVTVNEKEYAVCWEVSRPTTQGLTETIPRKQAVSVFQEERNDTLQEDGATEGERAESRSPRGGRFRLEDLSAFLRTERGQEVYVDRRQASRQVFLTVPPSQLNNESILSVLTLTTGLGQRKVGEVIFIGAEKGTTEWLRQNRGLEWVLFYQEMVRASRLWIGAVSDLVDVPQVGSGRIVLGDLPLPAQEAVVDELRQIGLSPRHPDVPLLRVLARPAERTQLPARLGLEMDFVAVEPEVLPEAVVGYTVRYAPLG